MSCDTKRKSAPTGPDEKKTPDDKRKGLAIRKKKYVPRFRREGATDDHDQHTILIRKLSKNTKEIDLQELCKPLGSTSRIYLGKNKHTGESRDFAYVTFHSKEDAAKAISALNGCEYNKRFLRVGWSTDK